MSTSESWIVAVLFVMIHAHLECIRSFLSLFEGLINFKIKKGWFFTLEMRLNIKLFF